MTTLEDGSRVENQRETAIDILCSRELSKLVELVFWSPEPDVFEVRSVDGWVRFRRETSGFTATYSIDRIVGRNPIGEQDPTRFSPLENEQENLHPGRRQNSYPYAYEHIAQVFDHRCAPDLCVLHTSSHRPEAHRGEHGSLDVIQARAPFIISGAGVKHAGMLERHCRLVDVAPTILSLLGIEPTIGIGPVGLPRDDAHLSRQDGDVISGLVDRRSEPPKRVIAFLMDGANPNMVYDMAAKGEASTIAGLIERGTAFKHGAFASYPSVTLPNHTTILTGCHPGHHGVLHNAWYDRKLGKQVVTESSTTWQESMQWLAPGIQTVHEALISARPDAVTLSVNEPSDRGATFSTFDLFRSGRARELGQLADTTPARTTIEFAESSDDYKWGTTVDSSSVRQLCALLEADFAGGPYRDPSFVWVNTALTDATSHECGPNSDMARAAVRDTDARISDMLTVVDRTLGSDDTTVIVLADHGMELNDPDVTGDWGEALSGAGIAFRDEASGFLYFDVGNA
jgi:phosphonoacetate hydrolase